MTRLIDRRDFLAGSSLAAAALAVPALLPGDDKEKKKKPLYQISPTQYSLHRMIGGGKLDNMDFTAFTRKEFGIAAVEYWNRPFFDKAKDKAYIGKMRKRADDVGVGATVILIDGEGNLGDPDTAKRKDSVERHKKWVEAAKKLGCHSIRVNARSKGSYQEQLKLAADGLRMLSEFAATIKMNVIVENHGGLSSNGAWLASVIAAVDHPRCGTLPDFGNFILDWTTRKEYDRYKGVEELMPYAKAVSAKSHDFGADGNETHTDYERMMGIVLDAGYRGWVGIEYEGNAMGEFEGIIRTRDLLNRIAAARDA